MSGHVTSIQEILAAGALLGERYHEFLRVAALSAGVYTLRPGDDDPQTPHTEDEVYYVVQGQAVLRIGEQDWPAEPGTVAYVPALMPHRFHSITEDLHVLVFFAPAESPGGAGC